MAKEVYENDELYKALGKFIISFTEIEHWLTSILEVFTDAENNVWLTLFFIDDLMTGRVRDTIHKVAKLRLEDNQPLHEQLKATLKGVGELTEDAMLLFMANGYSIRPSPSSTTMDSRRSRLGKVDTSGST